MKAPRGFVRQCQRQAKAPTWVAPLQNFAVSLYIYSGLNVNEIKTTWRPSEMCVCVLHWFYSAVRSSTGVRACPALGTAAASAAELLTRVTITAIRRCSVLHFTAFAFQRNGRSHLLIFEDFKQTYHTNTLPGTWVRVALLLTRPSPPRFSRISTTKLWTEM